ncbi:hypothetical protein AS52_02334 [Priestia megaterium Q3]|uniref:Uncharacterized protein n=1 Tax=Priestia megaterium Q3 TaxID=1452722 RepID=A0A806TZH6_PRIMG|nr:MULTISPECIES: hypothetical protein [Priestia]AKP77296.1 hypothetical protein AS52_02334 [Priestia megaterium Q3]MEB4869668.1 hypothetical protein [Priestia megaterium]WDW11192.1 hypothetical protein PWC21_11705 [Priestia aryabhattai]
MFDSIFPTGSGILITDAYYKFNKSGNIELVDLKPSAKVTWPFSLEKSGQKILSKKPASTQAGYTTHQVLYDLKLLKVREPYTTDITFTKGVAVKGKKDT